MLTSELKLLNCSTCSLDMQTVSTWYVIQTHHKHENTTRIFSINTFKALHRCYEYTKAVAEFTTFSQ